MANDDFDDLPPASASSPSSAEPDLSGFDDEFVAAEPPERGGDVPDGNYKVVVERFEIKSTKPKPGKTSAPMLSWALRCLEPCQGQIIWRNNVVSPKSLPFIKGDLHTAGLKVQKLSEISARKAEMIGVKLQVTKKTTKKRGDDGVERENVNVYINKRLADGDAAGGAGGDDFDVF